MAALLQGPALPQSAASSGGISSSLAPLALAACRTFPLQSPLCPPPPHTHHHHSTLHSTHIYVHTPAEDEALQALRIISAALGLAKLRRLDLSDNALGEKGIRACAAAFQEQVRRVYLAAC